MKYQVSRGLGVGGGRSTVPPLVVEIGPGNGEIFEVASWEDFRKGCVTGKVAPEKTGRAGEKVPEQTQCGEGKTSQVDTEQPEQRQLEQSLFSARISSR